MHALALQKWCEATLPQCAHWHGERIESFPSGSRQEAREKRQQEFSAGRHCARLCLETLQISQEVPVAEDRSPIWPSGVVGSISHSDLSVWAVVARATQLRSVGIDTESIDRAGKIDVQSTIASDEEWKLVDRLGFDAATSLSLVFSAKESFYKCWYPLTNCYFDFLDAIVVDANDDSISISHGPSNPNQGMRPETLDVRYQVRAGEVFTATWIGHPGGSV